MLEECRNLTAIFVAGFIQLHQKEPNDALICLVSTFIVCYAMLTPEERSRAMLCIGHMGTDINEERFEDGPDFLSFLADRILEQNDEKSNGELT